MLKQLKPYHKVKKLPYNIGETPVVKLESDFFSQLGNIYVKLEYLNPTGSIKDRAMYAMLSKYIESYEKKSEKLNFVLPSSGNAGISLSYITSRLGHECTIFASSQIAKSKLNLIKYFGGNIQIFDSDISTEPGGWIYEATAFKENNENTILIDQFNNQENVLIHQNTTSPELANYFSSQDLDLDIIFVGVGSGGTAEGILNFYKSEYPNTKVVALEPVGGVMHGAFYDYNAIYNDHRVEAISDRFVPQNISSVNRYDDVYQYTDSKMEYFQHKLMEKESLFVGEATGFIISAAVDYIRKNNLYEKNVALLATDNGYRYI